MMKRVAIIVSSCDAFKDCWGPFIYSVNKYWNDFPYDMFIVSNHQSLEDDKVKFIKVGDDKGWASNLKVALSEIEADFVLYLQEDYWLTSNVNTQMILSQIEYCETNRVDYLRLNIPFSDKTKINEQHASCSLKEDKYAICLQAAIWKKSTLEMLLVDGWSGWDYEANACQYVIDNKIPLKAEVVLSNYNKDLIFHYVDGTGVRKGKWTRSGAVFLKENGFNDILFKRKTEGWLISHLAIWRNNPIFHYSSSAAIKVLNKLKWNI